MRSRLVPQIYLPSLFLLAAILAFAGNLNSYFLSDDFVQIGKVLHGDFSVSWGQSHGGFFRPVFILSYIVDTRVWHQNAFGYHLTNVVIHALNSFLVYHLGLRLLFRVKLSPRSMKAAAVVAAALFLLHPSHTEAVTWISGRADLLATCFCLASLWSYCAYAEGSRASRFALALALGAAALLAKESAICLPFLVLSVGLYFRRGNRVLIEFAAFVLILVAFIAVRAFYLGAIVGGYGTGQHLNFAPGWIRDRLLEAIVRSTLPALPAAWSFFLFKPLQSVLFFTIALAFLISTAAIIVNRRRRYDAFQRKTQNRFLLVVVGLFLISLAPEINLRLSLYQSLGERFLYLPTVFSCFLISYVSLILIRQPKFWLIIMTCALAFYSWRLYAANQVWREASLVTRSISSQLAGVPETDRLTILNAPDNLRGVPVFHNGLPEALQFFPSERRFQQIEINAFQTLQSRFAMVTIQQSPDSLVLRAADPRDSFARTASADCLDVHSQGDNVLEFKTYPCLNQADVYFFSGGRMWPVLKQ